MPLSTVGQTMDKLRTGSVIIGFITDSSYKGFMSHKSPTEEYNFIEMQSSIKSSVFTIIRIERKGTFCTLIKSEEYSLKHWLVLCFMWNFFRDYREHRGSQEKIHQI